MGEFDLIRRYFSGPDWQMRSPAVVQGVGDDCALLQPAAGMQLAISCDTLNEGRHFVPGTDPARLGHKALAVNLSDLAACGAAPLGFTLGLSLPAIDESWLSAFAQGMQQLARASACPLVGGDTTRGPLALHITVFGQVPQGQALLRSGARPGDRVYVTGAIGEARAGLHVLQNTPPWDEAEAPVAAIKASITASAAEPVAACKARLIERLEAPTPRLVLGQRLRGVASSAIDLSDGLQGDLGHILRASGVGARLSGPALLATAPKLWRAPALAGWSTAQRVAFALAGGDDYELLFTAPPERHAQVLALGQGADGRGGDLPIHPIGHITATPGLTVLDEADAPIALTSASFDHFAWNVKSK
ncbi:thiamine-phosphate kinase [Allofranklinella schreckenbergeri]|uniref:Thiamine-monophosphate kinase n=1 Tax=Allofranklinella schreckenbergeri TaxID=1076744 RepID=A0A3M6QT63_9BURK|nr:thiamine-phosphate kinase [Allofranklinella schreckenbergeri]RMX06220.1 thiamine-phosphate kinase [Allofranklinella schreckenbergeri]